jgi:predicted Zn-dependent protease
MARYGHHTGFDMNKKPDFPSARRMLASVLCLALALPVAPATSAPAAPAAPAARGLPSLGDAGEMTTLEERKLGDQIARELYRDPDYLDDPILSDYIDGIWRRLLDGARARGELSAELDERYAWQVIVGRDSTVNAFSLPGGYFGLNTGLLGVVASRDELASVLGHEMSHVLQRHIARMLGQQARQTPLLLAAMVLGMVAATRNPQAGAALAVGGQAAMIQRQLNFSRDMEREADRIGFSIMTQAGFAPEGFTSMFEKLQSASRINDNGDWPYLRSHPLTTERMADMQQRVQSQVHHHAPDAGASAAGADAAAVDLEALMMAARARVLGRPGVDVLRAWAGEPGQPGFDRQPLARRAGALYAAALAHAELRDLPRAQAEAAQLAQAVGGDARAVRQARLLQAELALKAGQGARALEWLGDARESAGRAVLLLRAQAQTRAGQAEAAAAALQIWLSDHPHDAGAWQALAAACAAQGQTLRQLRAEGEVQMAHLDWSGAVDRWRAAQDFSRQQRGGNAALIEASIVDARLREARELLRRQQLDEQKSR